MARVPASRTRILDQAGYAYSFDRQMYVNRKTKTAFSVEYVQDHTEDKIRKLIKERREGAEWLFHFNSEPSDAVKHELECVLG